MVLAVLGILGVCAIVPELVCAHVHFCQTHEWQTPIAGRCSFGLQLWHNPCSNSHYYDVSPTYICWINYTQSFIRGKHSNVIFIINSPSFSVTSVSSIAVILFDAIVVVVTLAGTLGTWRVYKRSSWNTVSLTHLVAEQSMWLFLWQDNSHMQTSGLMRFGYFSHTYTTNTNWSLSDLYWLLVLLTQSCHWYDNTLIPMPWLTTH